MERLQQLLAFPLYASVAWLVWVLSQQAGPPGRGDRARPGSCCSASRPGCVPPAAARARAWRRGADRGSRARRRAGAGDAQPRRALGARARARGGAGRRGVGAVQPRAPGRASRRGHAGVRELHGRLVHYLSGERARGAPLAGRGPGLRRQGRGPAPGRLDPPRRADHPGAGRLRPERRPAVPPLPGRRPRPGRRRRDRAAPDPERGHRHPGRRARYDPGQPGKGGSSCPD